MADKTKPNVNIKGSGYMMPGQNDPPYAGGVEAVHNDRKVDKDTMKSAKDAFDKGELGKTYEEYFGKPKK